VNEKSATGADERIECRGMPRDARLSSAVTLSAKSSYHIAEVGGGLRPVMADL
jgi:hypothetical protein